MSYTWEEILGWFEEDPSKIEQPHAIIYAEYDNGGYDGQADVLFYDHGKFFYVYGSHCSCYGLDGQWNPEEYTAETLMGQVERATWGFFKDQKELIMSAIRNYSTPLGDLSLKYSELENKLRDAKQREATASEEIKELEPKLEKIKDEIRQLLS